MNLATLTNATLLAREGRGDHDGAGFLIFFGFIFVVLAGIAIYRAIQRRRHPERYGPEAWKLRRDRDSVASAEAILAERFAKGDLTANEYATARGVLRQSGNDPSS